MNPLIYPERAVLNNGLLLSVNQINGELSYITYITYIALPKSLQNQRSPLSEGNYPTLR